MSVMTYFSILFLCFIRLIYQFFIQKYLLDFAFDTPTVGTIPLVQMKGSRSRGLVNNGPPDKTFIGEALVKSF